MVTMRTSSPDETRAIGEEIGAACRGGEVILLEGGLGSGKTTLTQGLAAGLGIATTVISPTFIVLREYEGRLPLYHFDFYRLAETDRALDLEFDEYLGADGVCVIEWPSFAAELVPDEYLHIMLDIDGDATRMLTLQPHGPHHHALLQRLEPALGDKTVDKT